jgi:hypothetical protein
MGRGSIGRLKYLTFSGKVNCDTAMGYTWLTFSRVRRVIETSVIVYLMIRTFSTDSNSRHEIFSPTYRLCPDQPNIAIQANKDIGTFLNFTLSYLGIVSELQE